MPDSQFSAPLREFQCCHCSGIVAVPANFPATTGPCPLCGGTITSPEPGTAAPIAPAPVGAAAPAPAPAPGQTAQAASPAVAKPAAPQASRSWLLIGLTALLLVLLGVFAFVMLSFWQKPPVPQAATGQAKPSSTGSKQDHWKTETMAVLEKFLAATTVTEKLQHVIPSPGLKERMTDFYGGGTIDDSDTPADAFSTSASAAEDLQRGIFTLIYSRPPQLSMKRIFRPVAPLAVQWGLEPPTDLLRGAATVTNFTEEPVNVMAFFLKTPDGYKLDWDTFAQMKYSTMQAFMDVAEPGQSGVFRVVIWEDVPDQDGESQGSRIYRIASPATPQASHRIKVPVDSDIGRALAPLNWRRTSGPMPQMMTRTATIELTWKSSNGNPDLVISRFLCWEFLGVGGKEGNHLIKASAPTSPPAKQPTAPTKPAPAAGKAS